MLPPDVLGRDSLPVPLKEVAAARPKATEWEIAKGVPSGMQGASGLSDASRAREG